MRILISIFLVLSANVAFSEEILKVCNTGSPITNVRKGPSAKDYPKIGEIINGQDVEIIRRVTNSGGYDYYEIKFTAALSNGKLFESTGFVYHENLSKTCNKTVAEAVSEIENAAAARSPSEKRVALRHIKTADSNSKTAWG